MGFHLEGSKIKASNHMEEASGACSAKLSLSMSSLLSHSLVFLQALFPLSQGTGLFLLPGCSSG